MRKEYRTRYGRRALCIACSTALIVLGGCAGRETGPEAAKNVKNGSLSEYEELIGEKESGKESSKTNNSSGESNTEEDSITVEYTLVCDSKEGPKEVTRDGKVYEYAGISESKVIEEMKVIAKTMEAAVEDRSDLDRSVSYLSSVTGNSYTLTAKDEEILWGELQRIPKKVTETVEWGPRMDEVIIQPTKAITYYNKYTNREETVVGKLVSSHVSEPFWSPAEEPITGTFSKSQWDIDRYETSFLNAEGKPFSVQLDLEGAYPSWEGYAKDILGVLGLDEARYRITGAGWRAEPYWGTEYYPPVGREVAVEYRDAVYPFEALCRTCQARYEAEGESLGYRTDVTYYTLASDVTGKGGKYTQEEVKADISTIYRLLLSAVYREKES